MGRVPRISIAKAVWTTKLSSRMHAMYIIKLNLSARPTFDAAERHINLYKARMPWKRSEFNPQIVPGYIHPVPEGLPPAKLKKVEWTESRDIDGRTIGAMFATTFGGTTSNSISQYDGLYYERRVGKIMSDAWLKHIAKECGKSASEDEEEDDNA